MSTISGLQSTSLSSLYSAMLTSATGSSNSADSSLGSLYSAILASETGVPSADDGATSATNSTDSSSTDEAKKTLAAEAALSPTQLLNSFMPNYFNSENSGLDLSSMLLASLQARASSALPTQQSGTSLDVTG